MHPDRIFGLGFIALAGVLYALNWQLTDAPTLGDPGPTLLPSVIAVAMALLGLRLALKPAPPTVAEPAADSDEPDAAPTQPLSRAQWLAGVGSVANLLAYVVLLPLLGYALATLVFFTLGARLLGKPGGKALGVYALTALIITAISYALLTGVLDIHLPSGALFERFGE